MPRIYDCFTFFDEVELLELRLRTLDDVVDRFVVVEANVTFQGAEKPLNYPAHVGRFERWAEKIVYVPVTEMSECETAWQREGFQRRAILRGLVEASDDDLVVISDVDEIPRPDVLRRLVEECVGSVTLRMDMYYYYANLLMDRTWDFPKAARRREVSDPEALRRTGNLPVVKGAGWHFSYFMDPDGIRQKLAAFSHVEYSNERFMSPLHIERSMKFGIRLFGGGLNEIVPCADLPASLTDDPRCARYFHPGLTRFSSFLARAYAMTSSCRDVLPLWLTDGHPLLAFFVAAPFVGARRSRWAASTLYHRLTAI